MKTLFALLLLFVANTANSAIIDYSDGNLDRYHNNSSWFIGHKAIRVEHYFPGDSDRRPNYLTFVSEAVGSGLVSFDWEIASFEVLNKPTSIGYSTEFLNIKLFGGIINSNDVFRGHAEAMVSAGDTIFFSSKIGFGRSLSENFNITLNISNIVETPIPSVFEIPEPSTIALIFLGFGGLFGLKRRRIFPQTLLN